MISTGDIKWLKEQCQFDNFARILLRHFKDHPKDEIFNELDEKSSSEQTRIKQLLQALHRKNRELQTLREENQELQDEFEILAEDYQKIFSILNPEGEE